MIRNARAAGQACLGEIQGTYAIQSARVPAPVATYTLGPGVNEIARNFGVQSLGFTPGTCPNLTTRPCNRPMPNEAVLVSRRKSHRCHKLVTPRSRPQGYRSA